MQAVYVIHNFIEKFLLKDNYNLYLGKVSEIPKNESGEDFEVVYMLESQKEYSTLSEENKNLKYYFIILQRTKLNLEMSIETVKTEWEDFSETKIELEHITNNIKKIKRSFRQEILESKNESIIFKTTLVGFDQTSRKESDKAKKFILKVSTKHEWNFWS